MKKIILLATTLLLTAQSFAAPGICYSCLGIGHAPDVPPTPITTGELTARLSKLSSKDLTVCFTTSTCIAGAEGALSSVAVTALLNSLKAVTPGSSSSNYSEDFKKVMGISPDNMEATQLVSVDDISKIKQSGSGFINFYDKRLGGYTHTGYIQTDIEGNLYLYTANNADLINTLKFSDGVQVGKTPIFSHPLTEQKAKDLVEWIGQGYNAYYQPSKVVETNVAKFLLPK